jgi:hypothetical protein
MAKPGKFGLGAMTKRSLGSIQQPQPQSTSKAEIILRVTDIILDENHLLWDKNKGINQLGTIFGNQSLPNGNISNTLIKAKPAFSGITKIPLVNEYVKAFPSIVPNKATQDFYYSDIIPVWGMVSPNSNPYPVNTLNNTPPSQNLKYDQIDAGAFNIVDNKPLEISLNSVNNISQNTFKEKSNIHPLMPYMGDLIHEGRWGNSIRFSSTAKSKSKYSNNWSKIGNPGDPIIIIRNGQDRKANDFGAEPIVENVFNDLSSIYLTSYQSIPFSLSGLSQTSTPFNSYLNTFTTPPIPPSSFNFPQIILNSDRIVIDAQYNDVLISANRSVGLFANSSINLESEKVYISSNDIKLGIDPNSNNEQPILKGDDTVSLLISLVTIVKGLSEIIKHIRQYPSGTDHPDAVALIFGGQATFDLEDMIKLLKDEENGIKSKFVKSI